MARRILERRHESVGLHVGWFEFQSRFECRFCIARPTHRPVEISERKSREYFFGIKLYRFDKRGLRLLAAALCELDLAQVGICRPSIGIELNRLLDRFQRVLE